MVLYPYQMSVCLSELFHTLQKSVCLSEWLHTLTKSLSVWLSETFKKMDIEKIGHLPFPKGEEMAPKAPICEYLIIDRTDRLVPYDFTNIFWVLKKNISRLKGNKT